MTCYVCKNPMLAGRAYAFAVPSKNHTALKFVKKEVKGAIEFCGIRCAGAGLERFLQSGNLEMPNQQKDSEENL